MFSKIKPPLSNFGTYGFLNLLLLTFLALFLLLEVTNITFAGQPYFLASVFFLISLFIN